MGTPAKPKSERTPRCGIGERSRRSGDRQRLRPAGIAPLLLVIAALPACTPVSTRVATDPLSNSPAGPTRPWDGSGPAYPPGGVDATRRAAAEFPGVVADPDPDVTYDVGGLIDLALRINPQTRQSWEQARGAAARLGVAGGAYLPTLTLLAAAGYEQQENLAGTGPVFVTGPQVEPGIDLEWLLIDFGRRDADYDRALQQLLGANLQFNRVHQRVAYDVQRALYAYDAAQAQVDAAEATLTAAAAVEAEAVARLDRGLATRTEMLLARQEKARAAYEVQAAVRLAADGQAALAEVLGVSPTAPLRVQELSALPLPSRLSKSVEAVIDRALVQRPDLAASLADLRARAAEVRRAQAQFLPRIELAGGVGGLIGEYSPQDTPKHFHYAEPIYAGLVRFSWDLFEGFARRNRVIEAEAQRGAAAAALSALQLRILRDVWKAYADVQAAFLQYEFAEALLRASQDAYEAALLSYRNGLATIVDLLDAERGLARARTAIVTSRAEVLTTAATLAFAAGDAAGR